MGNAFIDEGLDKLEWNPPAPSLSASEIHRGVDPTYNVKLERATQPFSGELEHWSALPALSYFVLNAVALRESVRRVPHKSTFHPPPRLTLSDRKRESWFSDLKNNNIQLRHLSRAIPHGYTSKMLLNALLKRKIPIHRSVWFIKCVGANQVRAIKRKNLNNGNNGVNGKSPSANSSENDVQIEQQWIKEFTEDVTSFTVSIIDTFDTEHDQWKENMEFASCLVISLYSDRLIDQAQFLEWLLVQLREGSIEQLPCIVHFIQLLWEPLTGQAMAHKLFRTIAQRYNKVKPDTHDMDRLNFILEPVIMKLATTNIDTFVTPRSWPIIEPHVRTHPAYHRLVERNQAFLLSDTYRPSNWTLPLEAGSLLDNFVRPYRVDELLECLLNLDMEMAILLRTILTWTVRQATNASIQLCVALLKRISIRDSSLYISEYCNNFLFDTHLIYGSECLGALVSELLSARLLHLGLYVNRVISSGILYTLGPNKDLHIRILSNLPFDKLAPNIRTQVEMILHKASAPVHAANLDPFVSSAWNLFSGKPWPGLKINALSINDRQRLSNKLTELYERVLSSDSSSRVTLDPTNLVKFIKIIQKTSCSSMKPLFRILEMTLLSERSDSGLVSCVLRQVHVRLMAFVCSGLIDNFANQLVSKLQWSAYDFSGAMNNLAHPESSDTNDNNGVQEPTSIFQWVSWDDISALRAVIQNPSIMVELNRLVPLRQTYGMARTTCGHTPNDQDNVKQLLYRPGSPDIGTLLTLQGEEHLASSIIEYAQSPGADRAALLQLVTYGAVKIEDLGNSDPDKFSILRFLLLEPAHEMGYSLEEVESLKGIRKDYLERVDAKELFALSSSVVPMRFLSRMAHFFPNVFINRILAVLMASPKISSIILQDTKLETRCFGDLLTRCTPFNLRYYQGLTLIAFHEKTVEEISSEVFQSAFSHPESSAALQGLLQNIRYEAKEAIFTKSMQDFLELGLDATHLPLIDVYITLISALAPSIRGPVTWTLLKVPTFLNTLVSEATKVSERPPAIGCDKQLTEMHLLRKALSLVFRIAVVGRLHGVVLPAAALPYLEKLLHIQVFADNYHVRTLIEDSLRLLLRISQADPVIPPPSQQEPNALPNIQISLADADFGLHPNQVDDLKLFSKTQNSFGDIPVCPFDMIEEANPKINLTDAAIDLSYFEAYED